MVNSLQRLMVKAYNTVPYYNNVMNDLNIDPEKIKAVADLKMLPTTSKKEILDAGILNFISQEYDLQNDKNLVSEHTTGTTGEPFKIIWNKKELISALYPHWQYRYKNFGIDASKKFCSTFRNRGSREATIAIRNNKREMSIGKKYFDDEIMDIYYEQMMNFKPDWLYMQPGMLYIFADYILRNRLPAPPSLKYIEFVGEFVYDRYRNAVLSAFGNVKSSNMYGCEETKGIAYECQCGNFHLLNRNVIVEIMNDGKVLDFGEEGFVHLTGLCNTVMPIIRYNSGDRAVLYPGETCRCGNPNPVIKLKAGRVGEFLLIGKGELKNSRIIFPILRAGFDFNGFENHVPFNLEKPKGGRYSVVFKKSDKDENRIKKSFVKEISSFGLDADAWNLSFADNIKISEQTGVFILDF